MRSKNNFRIHKFLIIFLLIFTQKIFAQSILKRTCLYENLNKKNSCESSHEDQKLLQNSFQIYQANCHLKLNSTICQKASQNYPFLSQNLNSCSAEEACGFPYIENQKHLREACQKGFQKASSQLGSEISDSAKKAEEFILNLSSEFKKLIEETSQVSWDLLKDCLKNKSQCSPSKIKEVIEKLPEQIRQELAEIFQSMEEYECLNPEGKIQLLCYQAAMQSSGMVMNVVPGKLISRVGKKILGAESNAFKIVNNKKDSPSQTEVGLERLEKNLGRKVDISIEYKGSRLRPLYKLKDPQTGKIMGTLSLQYDPSGKTIHIGKMETNSEFRKLGVGESLFESAVQQFPDTEYISVELLDGTNEDAVRDHLAKGKNLEEAIKETPAYKIRSKMGFGEIIPQSIDKHSFGFKVKKSH